jgi:hypothetical protein
MEPLFLLSRACNLTETRPKEGVLFARRSFVLSAAVTASLISTLWLDEATAQTVPAAPATAPPAATPDISTTSDTAPAPAADTGSGSALADWSGETGDAQADRVVLKPPPSTRWMLVGAGLATTAAWYGASYGIGAMWPDAPGRKDLRIPVVGPVMDLTKTGCPKDDSNCSTYELVLRTVLVSLDLLGQAGGLGLLIEGAVFSPSGVEPSSSAQGKRSQPIDQAPTVVAVPMSMGQSGAGLGLVGRF